MDDLIKREDAIKAVENVSENYTKKGDREWHPHIDFIVDALKYVEPSVIPEPEEGEWIIHPNALLPEELTLECSVCHEEQPGLLQSFWIDKNFCPNCGAKMKEKERIKE